MLWVAAPRQGPGGQRIDPLIPLSGHVKRVATLINATIIDLRRAAASADGRAFMVDTAMARTD